MNGVFKVVEPLQRLVYSWEWNRDGRVSTVTVLFQDKGDQTEVTVIHEGLLDRESWQNHATGWDHYIQGLQDYL